MLPRGRPDVLMFYHPCWEASLISPHGELELTEGAHPLSPQIQTVNLQFNLSPESCLLRLDYPLLVREDEYSIKENPEANVVWRREQEFDLQLLERAMRTEQKEENNWVKIEPVSVTEADLEPEDYKLDISRELSKPEKVAIPERYVELEPEEPLTPEELAARHRTAEKIKNILTKSSMHNLQLPAQDNHISTNLDSQLQEQERIINISYALASEASQRSKEVAAKAVTER